MRLKKKDAPSKLYKSKTENQYNFSKIEMLVIKRVIKTRESKYLYLFRKPTICIVT